MEYFPKYFYGSELCYPPSCSGPFGHGPLHRPHRRHPREPRVLVDHHHDPRVRAIHVVVLL